MYDFINFVRGLFSTQNNDDVPTGAEAVVTDYNERQNLPEQAKEANGRFKAVERCTVSGIFNENVVCNLVIDLGDYGEYTITVDIEDELPEFMDRLNLTVEDLETLVNEAHHVPMIRKYGEWNINWTEVPKWDFYADGKGEYTDEEEGK